ncbi:MAG TPA: CHAT domain-containing protein [Blastocatellia bacterium]|nr:CHAT domain-containing protein [Blastocatellia bacterium]
MRRAAYPLLSASLIVFLATPAILAAQQANTGTTTAPPKTTTRRATTPTRRQSTVPRTSPPKNPNAGQSAPPTGGTKDQGHPPSHEGGGKPPSSSGEGETHPPPTTNPPPRRPTIIVDPWIGFDPISPRPRKPKAPESAPPPRPLSYDGRKFRMLADALLGAGDINAGLAVIQLLKDYEYQQYVGDPTLVASVPSPQPIARAASNGSAFFSQSDVIRAVAKDKKSKKSSGDSGKQNDAEGAQVFSSGEAWENVFEQLADDLLALSTEIRELQAVPVASRTSDQQKRLEKLEPRLAKARAAFDELLAAVAADTSGNDPRSARLRRADELAAALAKLPPGTVGLYTLVAPEHTWVIRVTPTIRAAYKSNVREADVNRIALAFRVALTDPTSDPLPLAQDLYKILLSRVDADLTAQGVRTILWSFDGVLRYFPVAALHDGRRYLVEKYDNVLFNRASVASLLDTPSSTVTGVGMGVARQVGDFSPLPSVEDELNGIFSDTRPGGLNGVVPGTVLLDSNFTEIAFEAVIRTGHPIVHVATHFHLAPTRASDSLLLLGDGTLESVGEIEKIDGAFRGIELLTLSACDTASSAPGADGREVECFGTIAQEKGARAVIASLWPVSDRSTSLLMQEFYRLRAQRPGATKAELLGDAQVMLLTNAGDIAGTSRGLVHVVPGGPPVATSFRHPYYWAPFVLIGNFK